MNDKKSLPSLDKFDDKLNEATAVVKAKTPDPMNAALGSVLQ